MEETGYPESGGNASYLHNNNNESALFKARFMVDNRIVLSLLVEVVAFFKILSGVYILLFEELGLGFVD